MTGIHIDPFMLGYIKDDFQDLNQVTEFIDNILELDELTKNSNYNFCKFYTLKDCEYILNYFFSYPSISVIESVINSFDIKHLSPRDIVYTISLIIKNLNKLEIDTYVDDLLCECNFDLPSPKVAQNKIEYLKKLLSLIYLLSYQNKYDTDDQILVTKQLDVKQIHVLNIVLKITYIIPETANNVKDEIKLKINSCNNFLLLNDFFTPVRLWKNKSFDLAIIKELKQTQLEQIYKYDMGGMFIESCLQTGFFQESSKVNSLLRSITQLISGTQPKKTHELREKKQKGSPKLKISSGEIAYKRDIDYEYHLLYWQKDSKIVLSKVALHNDNKIV